MKYEMCFVTICFPRSVPLQLALYKMGGLARALPRGEKKHPFPESGAQERCGCVRERDAQGCVINVCVHERCGSCVIGALEMWACVIVGERDVEGCVGGVCERNGGMWDRCVRDVGMCVQERCACVRCGCVCVVGVWVCV